MSRSRRTCPVLYPVPASRQPMRSALPFLPTLLELPPEAAAELVAFLHELADALERHYGAQIKRHYDEIARARRACGSDDPF